ncbi:MAG: hypothetical protein HC897_15615 [Thermoanaerobaculia bacterium]|nr:hypothetical protein [Thermoanaerobaculia bacterium]
MEQRRPTPEQIRQWLVSRIADILDVPAVEIEPSQPFSELGLTSADAVGLSGELEEWLGARFAPTLLYDHPTIESLSRAIAPHDGAEPIATHGDAEPIATLGDAEPIAIVGLGCRFPGAPDLAAFWNLLENGVDAIREVPAERWDLRELYDPDPAAPGKMSTRWGGFLDRVDGFEPAFFGISPQEAERMDPQQRLLMELAWEALEDAAIAPPTLAGSRTGVFVGISTHDYSRFQFSDPTRVDALGGTGNATSIAANRISYWLGLEGPSLAVDTACSSSLVALHLACQSLRAGDCELALVGGVNVILSPELTIIFSKAGLMAPDGRCKVFDSRADGYVRSEGAGMVVLKPLSRALAAIRSFLRYANATWTLKPRSVVLVGDGTWDTAQL